VSEIHLSTIATCPMYHVIRRRTANTWRRIGTELVPDPIEMAVCTNFRNLSSRASCSVISPDESTFAKMPRVISYIDKKDRIAFKENLYVQIFPAALWFETYSETLTSGCHQTFS